MAPHTSDSHSLGQFHLLSSVLDLGGPGAYIGRPGTTYFRPLSTVERLRMWGSRWYSQSLREGGLNDIHGSSPKTKVKARVLGGQGSSVQIQHDPAHDAAPRRPGDGSKWVLMWPGR